jgi:hypothetical protein
MPGIVTPPAAGDDAGAAAGAATSDFAAPDLGPPSVWTISTGTWAWLSA